MPTPQILFIDDTPSNLEIAEAYLEDIECAAHFASSGEVGLQLSQRQHFDIIFLDLEMPGLNGFQTAEKIRSHSLTPIIAMTAHSKIDIVEQLNKKHFNGYIGKPFSAEELLQLIENHGSLTLSNKSKEPLPTSNVKINDQIQSTSQILDLDAVRQRLKNNENLIKRILESFAKNNTHTFKALCESLAAEDWVTAKRICHTIKGGGANIGATALSSHSALIEKNCAARILPEQGALEKLNQLITKVICACQNELNTTTGQMISNKNDKNINEEKINEKLSSILINLQQDIGLAQDQLDELNHMTPENNKISEMVALLDQFEISRLAQTIENYIGANQ